MGRHFICVLLLATMSGEVSAGSFLWSDTSTAARTEAVSGTCVSCKKPKIERLPMAKPASGIRLSFKTKGKPLNGTCQRLFINKQGEFGPYGQRLANLMESKKYARHFQKNSSLKPICPEFASFTPEQKTMAWVWFWMVLANAEATCESNTYHSTHTPSGTLINYREGFGLFAAELHASDRKPRGPMCQGNIRSAEVQIRCAVDTIVDTQLEDGTNLVSQYSYWGPLTRSKRVARQIMPNMRGFKSCFKNM